LARLARLTRSCETFYRYRPAIYRFALGLLSLKIKEIIGDRIYIMDFVSLGTLLLSLLFGLMTLLFILRIVLTWYPQVDLNRLPFNLVAWPTEPFLVPVRKVIRPIGGVDISPIIWVGICTLLREMLLGQQGIITMALR
jgi:YggT family protein